jgi:hypothetical protein
MTVNRTMPRLLQVEEPFSQDAGRYRQYCGCEGFSSHFPRPENTLRRHYAV